MEDLVQLGTPRLDPALPPLAGAAALVTGASRGIGRMIALELASQGATVAVNYRSDEGAATRVVGEILAAGGSAIAVQADVADPAAVRAMVGRVIAELGRLDIVVNNAAITRDRLVHDVAEGDWQAVMAVNYGGVVNTTTAVLEHFLSRGSGVIINVSSALAERAWVGTSLYAASKAAVNGLTRGAALELARFGIRVCAVAPGLIETELATGMLQGGDRVSGQIPSRTIGRPEGVAAVVCFLASSAAADITGAVLTIDGGLSAAYGIGHPLPRIRQRV